MALRTPYAQEEAIDLSKHAVSGERESPLSALLGPFTSLLFLVPVHGVHGVPHVPEFLP